MTRLTPQGRNSKTFSPAPLDKDVSVPQMFDIQYTQSPDHPVYVYDREDGTLEYITFSQYVPVVHHAAKAILRDLEEGVSCSLLNGSGQAVVGILAHSDSISYATQILACCRAGHVPFAISTRNSVKGLANLLKSTRCAIIYVSQDDNMQSLLSDSLAMLKTSSAPLPKIVPMPFFPELRQEVEILPNNKSILLPTMRTPDMKQSAVIIHSSGSTSEFCKPIPLTHQIFAQWAQVAFYGEIDFCGEVMAAHSLPGFHGMALAMNVAGAFTGMIIAVFEPRKPPVLPRPDLALKGALSSKTTVIFCVPALLEVWSKTSEGMEFLKQLKAVIFAGTVLDKELGDKLIDEGVELQQCYGAIELACMTPFIPRKSLGKDWEYFNFGKHTLPVLTPYPSESSDRLYEVIFVDTPSHTPCFLNTIVTVNGEERRGYLINDILERHPTREDLWKIYGRSDDQIALSSGLKINPVPYELRINKHPKVAYSLVFGNGRPHPGLLIQLREDAGLTPQAAREHLRTTIHDANEHVQTHARISEKMIIFAKAEKPFDLTAKMYPRRPVVLEAYKSEIDDLYTGIHVEAA